MNAKLAKEVLVKLKEAGFVSAVVHYDGSGDSGQVEEISVFREGEPESYDAIVGSYDWEKIAAVRSERDAILRAIPMTIVSHYSTFDRETGKFIEKQTPQERDLRAGLGELAYDWLSETHGGWEINEGSYGDLVVHVEEMMVTLEHNERIMEVNTHMHTFACETGETGEVE